MEKYVYKCSECSDDNDQEPCTVILETGHPPSSPNLCHFGNGHADWWLEEDTDE